MEKEDGRQRYSLLATSDFVVVVDIVCLLLAFSGVVANKCQSVATTKEKLTVHHLFSLPARLSREA